MSKTIKQPLRYLTIPVLMKGFYSRVPQLSVLLEVEKVILIAGFNHRRSVLHSCNNCHIIRFQTLNRSSTQFPDGLARVSDPTGSMVIASGKKNARIVWSHMCKRFICQHNIAASSASPSLRVFVEGNGAPESAGEVPRNDCGRVSFAVERGPSSFL